MEREELDSNISPRVLALCEMQSASSRIFELELACLFSMTQSITQGTPAIVSYHDTQNTYTFTGAWEFIPLDKGYSQRILILSDETNVDVSKWLFRLSPKSSTPVTPLTHTHTHTNTHTHIYIYLYIRGGYGTSATRARHDQ